MVKSTQPKTGFLRLAALSLVLFSLVTQTLLFRLFLTVFDSHALVISGFFSSWLLWVGIGATLARRLPRPGRRASPWLPLLLAVAGILAAVTAVAMELRSSPADSGDQAAPTEKPREYILDSGDFAPDVNGYGGPLRLELTVDGDGRLEEIKVREHYETPQFFDRVRQWLPSLVGLDLTDPSELQEVDTVTGATVSSRAVLEILQRAGSHLAAEADPRPVVPAPESADGEPGLGGPAEGRARRVDWKALEEKRRRGELSEQEARYYRPLP